MQKIFEPGGRQVGIVDAVESNLEGRASSPPPLPIGRSERAGKLLFFGALAFLVGWLIFWPGPALPGTGFCTFQAASGFPCAFCGGTRAVKNLVRGNWERAMYFNPLAVLVVIVGAGVIMFLLTEIALNRRFLHPMNSLRKFVVLILGVALLVPWTFWHAWSAFHTPKPELIKAGHPLIRFFRGER